VYTISKWYELVIVYSISIWYARVDLKRRMIVLTGTRCTYFELKTTLKTFCMVIYAAIHCYISYKLVYNSCQNDVQTIDFLRKGSYAPASIWYELVIV
jgi:hypothetical protein